ncbi:hypothetical protein J3R82DRAFT_1857 [Butyriboletus roseoflavus]|nr:hypothetical protein J3R82DRAFT_1857 [Butyriboletus roseoflavus]
MYTNGGELWHCNVCVHSACKKCIFVPPKYLAVVKHKNVKFICLSCHLKNDAKIKTVMPYMAFYQDRNPVLTQLPQVHGPTNGPINMLYHFLWPYFVRAGGFSTKDVPFDLGSKEKRKTYKKNATKVANSILAMSPSTVVFAICESRTPTMIEVIYLPAKRAIKPWLLIFRNPFKRVTHSAILYMLSCGRYIHHSESRTEFMKAVAKLGFSTSIAFNARCFHPSVAWTFLVMLTELVVLQGHLFEDVVPVALSKSNGLDHHSRVFLLHLSPDYKFINTR